MAGPRVATGPHRPVDRTPERAPGSIRRTTHLDAWRSTGADRTIFLTGRGRDLLTVGPGPLAASAIPAGAGHGDRPVVVADETVAVEVDEKQRAVLVLEAAIPDDVVGALRGQSLRGAFRHALAGAGLAGANLVYALLDELPAVSMVWGYHLLRLAGTDGPTPHVDIGSMAGVCAGWAVGSSMLQAAERDGRAPIILGPPAPELAPKLADGGDPWGWHDLPPRRPGTIRRRRRTDVGPPEAGRRAVDAMFRDTYTEPDGSETVVHEYAVRATIDGDRLVAVDADPRVLPAWECPSAAPSAGDMAGATLADLRVQVRRDLRGAGTCTHLNDLLRTFADLPDLVAAAG